MNSPGKQTMSFDDVDHCISAIAQLTPERRLHFFELLAHNLTVAARVVWADEQLTPAEQVQSLKALNECLHRATSRVWVERLRTHAWSDEDFVSMLGGTDASLHPNVRGVVGSAFNLSLDTVSK